MSAELVTARHLGRKAVIYVRQSSPHQVLTNQESLRLQYALRQRARELGWQEASIEVIDADLGLSGAAAAHRRGFKELIARVTLGEVGLEGVTRDQLIWTAGAYIRPETYKAALAGIIDAHHALPVAAAWGDGTTLSSDGQFFRSAKRGDAAGEVNARYGRDPGLSFYTHVSDQHG